VSWYLEAVRAINNNHISDVVNFKSCNHAFTSKSLEILDIDIDIDNAYLYGISILTDTIEIFVL
jgi:hypothetical protein